MRVVNETFSPHSNILCSSRAKLSLLTVMSLRSSNRDGSFHCAISRVLFMGNFIGFPICGFFSRDLSNLRFSWKSLRAIHSFYLLMMSIFFMICFILWLIKHGNPNFSKFVSLATFIRNVFSLILFHKLAREWPSLMLRWKSVEDSLPMLNDSKDKNFLKTRLLMIQVLVTSVSVGGSMIKQSHNCI